MDVAEQARDGRRAAAQGFRPPLGMRCIDATVLATVGWERALSGSVHQEGLRVES